ncbi:nitrite reductase small subunit NirD [Neobacillus dielmonensis]|uniref:nitrite reductase small subunit NirD n=1 Tax=Neobacillus dielmonensis TaxID=1347369 RepID=UPI000A4225D8|nr:nitrite reductase small subunit NirD [Neobacillus dielmonensis]
MVEAIRYRIKVGEVNEIPKEIGKTVKIGPLEIALFRLASGEIRAIENRCPHKGGVLAEGMVSGDHVFCPMHDWKINVTDGKVQAPDVGCVKTYEAVIEDGEVIIIL